jgi:phosphohistidine phosphatase
MRIYLLRHGIAQDGTPTLDDYNRQLTEVGAARVGVAARGLRKLGVALTALYSSPRIRAKQTAEIVAATLNIPVQFDARVDYPQFSAHTLAQLLQAHQTGDEIMFVGHEPTLSLTVRDLCGAAIDMKKCGMARLLIVSHSPLRGMLEWMIAPKMFDVLGA